MAYFLIIYIVVLLLPILFWFWFFRSSDVSDQEPKKLLFSLFILWGFFSALLVTSLTAILEKAIPGFLEAAEDIILANNGTISAKIFLGLFVSIIFEEAAKFIALWTATYYSRYFTQIMDGIIYGVSLGLGFAFFENTMYFYEFTKMDLNGFQFLFAVFSRTINPLIMHLVTAGIMGLYMGRKKFSPNHKKSFLFKGLAIAILIHSAYNLPLFLTDSPLIRISPFVIAVAGLTYLIRQMSKDENRMIWKTSQ